MKSGFFGSVKVALVSGAVLAAGYFSVGTASAGVRLYSTCSNFGPFNISPSTYCSNANQGGGIAQYDTANGTYRPGTAISGRAESINFDIDNAFGLNSYRAAVTARANYGVLGAKTSVQFTNSASLVSLNTEALAFAHWDDRATISSSTLAIGTPIIVRMTNIINIANSNSYVSSFRFQSKSLLRAYNGSGANAGCLDSGYYSQDRGPACQNNNPQGFVSLVVGSNVLSRDYLTYIGDPNFSFDFSLEVSSAAETVYFGDFVGSASSSIDAFGTAHSYLTVLTPDATLTSQSGHDYSLPSLGGVPEPTSWTLMLTGFGLVGGGMRRRVAKVATA